MTPEQEERTALMEKIAQEISNATQTQYILKGGTALKFAYGLDRFSTDLDYDSTHHIDLAKILEKAVTLHQSEKVFINLKKQTDTTQRYMIHFGSKSSPDPLKIECSTRNREKLKPTHIQKSNGIAVYNIGVLADQKIEAFSSRKTARDIYDVNFLLQKYPQAISQQSLQKLVDFCAKNSMDSVERDYELAKGKDTALYHSDPIRVIVPLYENVEKLAQKHNLTPVKQVDASSKKRMRF